MSGRRAAAEGGDAAALDEADVEDEGEGVVVAAPPSATKPPAAKKPVKGRKK